MRHTLRPDPRPVLSSKKTTPLVYFISSLCGFQVLLFGRTTANEEKADAAGMIAQGEEKSRMVELEG
jgi:hypothetical protein